MRRGIIAIAMVLAGGLPAQARQGLPPSSFGQPVISLRSVDMVVMPPVDVAALRAEDEKALAEGIGGPARFAAPIPVDLDARRDGTWETLPDGSRLWRIRIVSPGAFSLNFGFSRFRVPEGATVHFYPVAPVPAVLAWDGPYDAADASPDGQFWTAIVPGDDAMIELRVADEAAFEPDLVISQVGHDYRGFGSLSRALLRTGEKQGSCNNDVICPVGDPWRNEIRSVGVYSLGGSKTCTGSLINSHDPNHPTYFLTAYHCSITETNAGSMVVYWNYESATCGALSGGLLNEHQSGAELKAKYMNSDFCLVRLIQTPAQASNVYYAGWDAREETSPAAAVCIHHPNCDEKAISFANTPLTQATYMLDPEPGDGTHWRVFTWDDGTTEPGSSGSGLWDPNHRIVGQLHGGYASCTDFRSDWFGRLSRSWDGGGLPTSSLKGWLDPAASNVRFVEGRNWDSGISLPGDADLSGGVNVQDLALIVAHVLGTQVVTGQGFVNADRNSDGRLSVVDLVAVVNIILQGSPVARRAESASGALTPGATKAVQLAASFDPVQDMVVFRAVAPSPRAADGGEDPGSAALPVAVSLVLTADPGVFTVGLLPVRFPQGGGWQGLATAADDGTVRAVLFDPAAGASGPLPVFALPLAGDAGTLRGEIRFVEGDAADQAAVALSLQATGFPLRVGPADGGSNIQGTTLAVQPNPARAGCALRFDLPRPASAAVSVFDPAGRAVYSRDLGALQAGTAVTQISARDIASLVPGLYFVRLTLNDKPAGSARLIVVR